MDQIEALTKARIVAFRAIDKPDLCDKFIEGHRRVLSGIGVHKLTSSRDEWASNRASFVVLVESLDGQKVLGGARLQAADGITRLPLEEATGYMDAKVYDLIYDYSLEGVAEVCGLWNSAEVSGMGIGSIFLIRSALAMSNQIGLKAMFALCSPFTTRIAGNYGFLTEESIGNKGTFYYPKLDLLATLTVQKDAEGLSNASDLEKDRIMDLRKTPVQLTMELARRKIVEIDYSLMLEHVNTDEFRLKEKVL
jgi:hypothetical protein